VGRGRGGRAWDKYGNGLARKAAGTALYTCMFDPFRGVLLHLGKHLREFWVER
jgi:hypothetical protein